jgi:hypothetical protein
LEIAEIWTTSQRGATRRDATRRSDRIGSDRSGCRARSCGVTLRRSDVPTLLGGMEFTVCTAFTAFTAPSRMEGRHASAPERCGADSNDEKGGRRSSTPRHTLLRHNRATTGPPLPTPSHMILPAARSTPHHTTPDSPHRSHPRSYPKQDGSRATTRPHPSSAAARAAPLQPATRRSRSRSRRWSSPSIPRGGTRTR